MKRQRPKGTIMPKYDGGPAFPRPTFAPHDVGYEDAGICDKQEGMSLRDWFAGQAISGMHDFSGRDPVKVADFAYKLADAMIDRRCTEGD